MSRNCRPRSLDLLTVASTSTNQLAFSIRGQAVDAFSYTSPTVLAYFDEFQTGGTTATTFFDLQSVQVLKGPQGTLFGRNATGGAILYTSTQPGKALEGYFNYTAGNFNEQKAEGAVTIPLAEWASVRWPRKTSIAMAMSTISISMSMRARSTTAISAARCC